MQLCAYRCGRESLPDVDYCDRCGSEAIIRIWEHERRVKERRRESADSRDRAVIDRRQPPSRIV